MRGDGLDNEQAGLGDDGYRFSKMKAKFVQPIAAEPDLRHFGSAEFVEPHFGVDFEAPHFGAPRVLSLVGSHINLRLIKRPGGAANQQENLCSTGLTPALRQALSLICK